MEFIRFGGLSKVNYKKVLKGERTFHTPPVKKGIYAFIYPYIEDFLWVWKIDDKIMEASYDGNNTKYNNEYHRLRKKFKYNGDIWTHLVNEAIISGLGIKYIGDYWVKVHSNDLNFLLKKCKHRDIKALNKNTRCVISNPYKLGLGGNMSKDHLEVFIEKLN